MIPPQKVIRIIQIIQMRTKRMNMKPIPGLLWIAQMKKDPIHKQIMKTKDAFANDDNFDPEEALEAAVDRRKFLMKRLFGDTRSTNTL